MDERFFPTLSYVSNQKIVAKFDSSPSDLLLKRLAKYRDATVEVIIHDPRGISDDQRKMIYALMWDIDKNYTANGDIELTKKELKDEFIMRDSKRKMFSLSDCSMDTAREFIDFLIDFSLENGVILDGSISLIQGSYALAYFALKYHRCVLCGRPADIAHIDAVGSGNDRAHMSHIGKRVMALCREHHNIQHNIGIQTFLKENHIVGIKIDSDIERMLRLGNWRIDSEEENDADESGRQ